MAAPKKNEFWKLRSKHGRNKLFKSSAMLWQAACEYFQWCEDNPLYEEKGFAFQGTVTHESFAKMRAMTMDGLCFYLHCNQAYFRQFKDSLPKDEEDFSTIIIDIEKTVYRQKFEGAAADLLNANLIARDLGLKDRTDITTDDKPIEPITGFQIVIDGTKD
jgi:hypothetical protein